MKRIADLPEKNASASPSDAENFADASFSAAVIDWQKRHGRHALPWQNTRDGYRIWLSEIMLQQTQVSAVIPYYQRFLLRFPTVVSLASAASEEVMALWSGLGYYSRARNLHRCAQRVVAEHGGLFPDDPDLLADLPGIGRSTAAAIAAFAYGKRAANGQRSQAGLLRVQSVAPRSIKPCVYDAISPNGNRCTARRHN